MKKKILIIIVLLTIFLAIGYNTYLIYKVAKIAQNNNAILQFLFTLDENKITGFTKEVFNSLQVIDGLNKQK